MKTLMDYPYFLKETVSINGNVYCGEYGKCAVCGKRSQKYWLGFGIASQFHFCSRKHKDLFLAALSHKEVL